MAACHFRQRRTKRGQVVGALEQLARIARPPRCWSVSGFRHESPPLTHRPRAGSENQVPSHASSLVGLRWVEQREVVQRAEMHPLRLDRPPASLESGSGAVATRIHTQRGSGPGARDIRSGPASRCQLSARTPTKRDETGDSRRCGEDADAPDIWRDKAVAADNQRLLAMQKVEGSSPFSRFAAAQRSAVGALTGLAESGRPAVPVEAQHGGVIAQLSAARLDDGPGQVLDRFAGVQVSNWRPGSTLRRSRWRSARASRP